MLRRLAAVARTTNWSPAQHIEGSDPPPPPRQAMLQQGVEIGKTAGGSHHDLRGGIERPDLEGRLKGDRAVGAQQQNGTSSLGTGLAQHVGQARRSTPWRGRSKARRR